MAGQGTLIAALDYNNIQSKLATIFGTGSGDYGYGQTVTSSQVSVNNKVSVSQWSTLRGELIKCRQHQTGLDETATLTNPTTATKVTEADRAAYAAMADLITVNRLVIPPVGQASLENLFAPAVRTAAWNGTITHTVTVNFGTSDACRAYFNAGGSFRFSGSRSGGTAGLKNTSWTTLLTNMGTINFGRNATTTTGSGTAQALGYANITTSNQIIYSKSTEEPTYTGNLYRISVAGNAASGSNSTVVFTIDFIDGSGQPNPPWGSDENVDGTLTSTIQVYRASGVNVSTALPPATSSGP